MDKVPPHDATAEMAVIGSMLIEQQAVQKAANHLKAEDFYDERNRKIFSAMIEMLAADGKGGIDMVTVAAKLHMDGKLSETDGRGYMAECFNAVATAAHAEYYADIVRKHSIDRQITAKLRAIYETRSREDLRELGDLIGAYDGTMSDYILDFQKDLHQAIDELLDKKHKTTMTGFKALDSVTSGHEDGELWIVGARTSGGKTALMTRMMCNMALADVPCLYVTTEMTSNQMVGRILPMASGVPAWKFRKRVLNDNDVKSVMDACADSLSPLPIKIYGRSRVGISEIRSAVIRAKPKVIFVDYLQRCKMPKGDNRVYQIEDLMVELKSMTQDLGVVTFLGAQLDRALDKNPGSPPVLADLRGSGAIEHEADGVLLLWKPPEETLKKRIGFVPTAPGKIHIEGIVAKGRSCPAGVTAQFELEGDLIKMSEKTVERNEEDGYREERWTPQGAQ